jgi:hypothetical protein
LVGSLAGLGHEVVVMLEQRKRPQLKDRDGVLAALTRNHPGVHEVILPAAAKTVPAGPGRGLARRISRRLPFSSWPSVPPALDAEVRHIAADLVISCPPSEPHTARAAVERAARALKVPGVALVDSWDDLLARPLPDKPSAVGVWNTRQAAAARSRLEVPAEAVLLAGAPGFDRLLSFSPTMDRERFCEHEGLDPERRFRLFVIGGELSALGPGWVFGHARTLLRAGVEEQLLVIGHDTETLKDLLSAPKPPADLDGVVVWSVPDVGRPAVSRSRYLHAVHHAAGVISTESTPLLEAALLARPAHLLTEPHRASADGGLEQATGGAVRPVPANGPLPECARNLQRVQALVLPRGAEEPVAPRLAAELTSLAGDTSNGDWRPLRHVVTKAPKPQVIPAFRARTESELAVLRFKLQEATRGDGPVLAGPFSTEVGFELLYWIPFLRWMQHELPGLAERLIVVSRGGTASWSADFASRYVDIYSVCEPLEILERRQSQKQRKPTELDIDLLGRVSEHLGLSKASTLHPSLFFEYYYRTLKCDHRSFPRSVVADAEGIHGLAARYRPIVAPVRSELDDVLPEDFVAVRFYARPSFPNTEENRRFIKRTIERLVAESPVVLLNNGMELDEHVDFNTADGSVTTIDQFMKPVDNLDVQTAVLARARAFVGTYGGLSYLAPHVGVPSLAFSSLPEHTHPFHLELAQRIFDGPGFGDIVSLRAADLELIELVTPPAGGRR